MNTINELLTDEDTLLFIILGTVGMTAIIGGIITSIVKSGHRERTRREIAAYIAEGSMTPEQGEKVIRAKFRDD
ncbi:MAG: hypothetical protein AAFY58_06160 [Planctomycetota bacterium]